uniref:reverse transcriptase N-terminal domain-containing protein n=1 Tax=Cyanothece sp. BG0011 TaxID=2082950 RepID=UPI0018E52DCE
MSKARIIKTTQEWNTINWAKVQRKVFKLQKKIFQAVKSGNKVKAKKLQKLLLKSHYAKLLAVRKVTQDNQGRKTAGIDGTKALRPNQRVNLAYELNVKGYKAKALRRIWIPKPGRDEKRPLGIPTIKDRAMQALVKSALEPYWEAQFEGTSYGFRPGRSAHDAIGRIYSAINKKAKYVLDADISKCFDKINHDYLLSKVDCPTCMKHLIKRWLKCGVIDNGVFEDTNSGTPQGGVSALRSVLW